MARIRSRGNKDTELRMIELLRAHGITGWRRGMVLFGKPDFVFHRERVALFVDGCFWHGCPKAKHAPLPKDNADWWAAKLSRNKKRDRLVNRSLRKAGWTVLRVWECDLARKHWLRMACCLRRALGRVTNHRYSPTRDDRKFIAGFREPALEALPPRENSRRTRKPAGKP